LVLPIGRKKKTATGVSLHFHSGVSLAVQRESKRGIRHGFFFLYSVKENTAIETQFALGCYYIVFVTTVRRKSKRGKRLVFYVLSIVMEKKAVGTLITLL